MSKRSFMSNSFNRFIGIFLLFISSLGNTCSGINNNDGSYNTALSAWGTVQMEKSLFCEINMKNNKLYCFADKNENDSVYGYYTERDNSVQKINNNTSSATVKKSFLCHLIPRIVICGVIGYGIGYAYGDTVNSLASLGEGDKKGKTDTTNEIAVSSALIGVAIGILWSFNTWEK